MKTYTIFSLLLLGLILNSQNKPFKELDVKNVLINCENNLLNNSCAEIIPDFTDIKKTTSYDVKTLTYPANVNFNQGIDVQIQEDRFSDIIPLSFKFDFYETTYENIVIAENGVISFNTVNANGPIFPRMEGSISNPSIVNRSIFGAYQDLKLDPNGKIKYFIDGTFPFRRFVVNFYNLLQNGCTTRSTSQIILYETFNQVDILIDSKPNACGSAVEQEALIGMKNNNSQFLVPSGRDVGIWQTQKEAWNFEPNDSTSTRFEWIDTSSDAIVSTEQKPKLCPEKNTTYQVKLYYKHEDNTETLLNQNIKTFQFTFDPEVPIAINFNHQICDLLADKKETIDLYRETEKKALNGQTGFLYKIYRTENDAKIDINQIPRGTMETFNNFNFDRTFYYRLENPNKQDCYSIKILNIRLAEAPVNMLRTEVSICHVFNNPSADVNLHEVLDKLILGNQQDVQITYHKTESEAQTFDPITNNNQIQDFKISPNSLTVYVRLSRNNQCIVIESIKFKLESAPENKNIIVKEICDNLNNLSEIYDLTQHEPQMSGSSFSYYLDENLTRLISKPNQQVLSLNSFPIIFYVKALNLNGCFTVNKITIQGKVEGIISQKYIADPLCDPTNDEYLPINQRNKGIYFDLKDLAEKNMIKEPELYNIDFFEDEKLEFPINKDSIQRYNVKIPGKVIFVRFQSKKTGCHDVQKLSLIVLDRPKVSENPERPKLIFCKPEDLKDKEIEITNIDLDSYQEDIMGEDATNNNGKHRFDIKWYKDRALRQEITLTNPLKVKDKALIWIKMERPQNQGGCFRIDTISVHANITRNLDIIKNAEYKFCNDITYQNGAAYEPMFYLNVLVKKVIKNNPDYLTRPYYLNSNNIKVGINQSSNIEFIYSTLGIRTFYIDVEEKGDKCGKSTAVIKIIKYEEAKTNNLNVELCSLEDTKIEDLTKYPALTGGSPTSNFSYYLHIAWAGIGGDFQRIPDPTKHKLNLGENRVYIREVTQNSNCDPEQACNCVKVSELILNVTKTPEIKINSLVFCDENNDGSENDFNLSSLDSQIIGLQKNVILTYHNTKSEAENLNNQGITTLNINNISTKVWARVLDAINKSCYLVKELNFIAETYPIININITYQICDINNDNKEYFNFESNEELKKLIINNPENYKIEFYNTNGLLIATDTITNQNNKFTARIYNKDNIAQCYSESKITINFFPSVKVNNYNARFCDQDNNNQITVPDLRAFKNQMLKDYCNGSQTCLDSIVDEYYLSYNPITLELSNQITNTNNFTVFEPTLRVYIKFIDNTYGCFSIGTLTLSQVQIIIRDNQEYKICDNDLNGKYDFNLNELKSLVLINNIEGVQFSFYRSQADLDQDINQIPSDQIFEIEPNQMPYLIYVKVFVKTEDSNICYASTSVKIIKNEQTLVDKKIFLFNIECDDDYDGKLNWNLTKFNSEFTQSQTAEISYFDNINDANLNQNLITNIENYPLQTGTSIFLRITEQDLCSTVVEVKVELKPLVVIPVEDNVSFCQNQSITIDASIPEITNQENYIWRKGGLNGEIIQTGSKIEISEIGLYTISITGLNDCISYKTINASQIKNPEINQLIVTDKSVRIVVNNNDSQAPYRYYLLKDEVWIGQDSDTFTNLPEGKQTFKVESLVTGCQSESKSTIIIFIRNVITPNEDGINDNWIIDDINVFNGLIAKLTIYNRYGKIVHNQESNSKLSWDGIENRIFLPPTSYWYKIEIPDGRSYTGYIVVKY